ncbi:MAG: hypothetical protein ACXVAX_08365 [Pseudobdellovibrio sp.]
MANNDKKDPKDKEESTGLSDTLRKIISAGSPTDISKELIGTVLNQALKAKDDITLKVSNEMISLVRKIDFVKEFSKFAENHKFKVTAEIEILKKDNNSQS